ncbi:MAG: thermonuclease family protein [Bacilli bacterium]|nr:thermonuclease family protein [Staphylococcus sp.]
MKKILLSIFVLIGLFVFVSCDNTNKNNYTSDNYDWKTPQTDKLKLTQSYEGKDFIEDGIGEVTPIRYVDGDTTIFKTSNGIQFTVRYNGINTPESTYRIEPWGFAASTYNKKKFETELASGAKVVLQAEDLTQRLDTTGRYLAWVWFVYPDGDSRLLNLELAEYGYAFVKSADGTQYGKYFTDAIFDISIKKLRIYGEVDKDYDYSTEAKEMSIKEIRETYGTEEAIDASRNGFTSPLIKVSGVVVRKNGQTNAYIQQYDDSTGKYYGIYVYGGYNSISKLIEGAYVQITAKVGYYYGSLQITDLTSDSKIKVYTFDAKDQIAVIDETCDSINDIRAYDKIGTLVKVNNLKVTGYKDANNSSAITLYCEYQDTKGQTQRLNVRIDQNVLLKDPITGSQILSGSYFTGKTFSSITGIVTYYNGATAEPENNYANGHIQLALTTMNDVVFAE